MGKELINTPFYKEMTEMKKEFASVLPESLTSWEQGFVDNMTDSLERHGESMTVSDRQWEILERIRDKAA